MMVERCIGSIVIMDGNEPLRPVGIITERDVVQFQAFELDLDQLLAQAVMSSPLFCLQPTHSLWAAQQVMQTNNIRRLVITNDRGELVGILTQSNLLQLLERTVLQVRHILTEIISVARQTFPKSIEIEVNYPSEDLWMVSVDATHIHQVLMNLFAEGVTSPPETFSPTRSGG